MTRDAPFTNQPASTLIGSTADQEGDVKEVEELESEVSPFDEMGATGLKRSAGYIDEEFLPQLRGRKAVKVFKEMSENDPLVGALLFAIKNLIRRVEWNVTPGGKSKEDTLIAELVETSMEDMSHSWGEFITEVLSMLTYGWSYHEIVYKRRGGLYQDNSKLRSKHTDNLVSWRKMPIRAQETLHRWVFDDTGDTVGMIQLPPPSYKQVTVPMSRALLFRPSHSKGNPEGTSMLRNAYRPWYMKKRIEEFEAIGVERDLAGLPIVKVPAEWLNAKKGSQQWKSLQNFKKLARSVRRDEQEGIVFPQAYDQNSGKPLYEFALLGSGGGRQFQTDQIIRRYEERILMTVLADFIMVGHQTVGSYSLHTDKTGIFRASLNAIVQTIADTLNRHAIPRLLRVNGFRPEETPTLVPTDIDAPDLNQLSSFMASMSGMGLEWFPDPEMEKFVRATARLPKASEEDLEREKKMAARSDATRFMGVMGEYLDSRAGLNEQVQQFVGDPEGGQQPMSHRGMELGGQPGQPGQKPQPQQQGGA